MPGKQARVLCPVCQEPIPPDETECGNCGAFVIDEAVVRLSRAFGLDREAALKLFEAGFRHPTQLRDRDPNRVLEKGEVGLLFICTNCGGFVASGDSKCPRCAAEFESEAETERPAEEDILDLLLCPVCGADNDADVVECEICGEVLKETSAVPPVASTLETSPSRKPAEPANALAHVDDFLREVDTQRPEPLPTSARRKATEMHEAVGKVAPPGPAARLASVTKESARASGKPSAPATPRPASDLSSPVPTAAPRAPTRETVPRVRPERVPTTSVVPPHAASSTRIEKKTLAPLAAPKVLKTRPPNAIPFRRPAALPKRRVRTPPPPPFSPETVAGFVLAAALGLLLAGALGQNLVSAGIGASLLGLAAVALIALARGTIPRPTRSDGVVLAVGVSLGLLAPLSTGISPLAATSLALGSGVTLAGLARQLARTPRRVFIAVGSGVALVGHALVSALNPAYPMTLPWIVGIAATMPWPAALASIEIVRRNSAIALRRQLVRAERNIERKDYERSIAEYDRAIAAISRDVPGAEIPWYGKGATLILLGRYEEALRAIDKALDINPRNEVAWVNKGNALTRMGQLLDALRCFNAAIKVNPLYEVAWNNKGNGLARLGKFDEALRCYERALAIDPGYRGAWVNMGFVLTKLGRLDEAASCADQALRLENRRSAAPS